MERRIINPWPWTEHYGVAQGVEISGASRTLLCSGQIAVRGGVRYPGKRDRACFDSA